MCHKGKKQHIPWRRGRKRRRYYTSCGDPDKERERRTHHAGLRAQFLPSPSVDGAASCVFKFQIRAKTAFVDTLESTTGPPVLTPVAAIMRRQDRTGPGPGPRCPT